MLTELISQFLMEHIHVHYHYHHQFDYRLPATSESDNESVVSRASVSTSPSRDPVIAAEPVLDPTETDDTRRRSYVSPNQQDLPNMLKLLRMSDVQRPHRNPRKAHRTVYYRDI